MEKNGNYRDGGISGYGIWWHKFRPCSILGIDCHLAASRPAFCGGQHSGFLSLWCGGCSISQNCQHWFLLKGLRHPPSPCSMGGCLTSIIVATEINSILCFPSPLSCERLDLLLQLNDYSRIVTRASTILVTFVTREISRNEKR